MKAGKKFLLFTLTACFVLAGALLPSDQAYAKALTSTAEAREKALQKVKDATVIEVERDKEDGVVVYEVELVKNSKKYSLTYRASDSKLIAYKWEKTSVSARRDKSLISESKCKSLAKNQVKSATITSIRQKTDDGIDIYKVIMSSDTKKYTLEYHARTGSLIEYEWELLPADSSDTRNDYISAEEAQKIAQKKVPGATIVKTKLDIDDGVPVYEVELIKGIYEYELEIHAVTGEIIKYDKDIDD